MMLRKNIEELPESGKVEIWQKNAQAELPLFPPALRIFSETPEIHPNLP